jgi:hypothetical protein
MIVRTYSSGKPTEVDVPFPVVEIVLPDGRTAQMHFGESGSLSVRAWGNVPILLGNLDQTAFRAQVVYEPARIEIKEAPNG